MLPFNNDLVSYTDQSIFRRPFFNETDQLNSPNNEDDPHFFFHFSSSSFIHRHELELEDHNFLLKQIYYNDLLLPPPHDEPVTHLDDITVPEIRVDMVVDSSNKSTDGLLAAKEFSDEKVICNNNNQKPRSNNNKRYSSSKNKDRHSKINTAKGPRDRRMRLSLDVARKFFDLQDMLGYDKASKTVEWLLIQAKSEITKLERCLLGVNYNYCGGGVVGGANSTSFADEVIEAEAVVMMDDKAAAVGGNNKLSAKEKKIKHNSRKMIIRRPHAKDSREKARARARERTSKKMWSRYDETKLTTTTTTDEVIIKNKELGTQTQNKKKNHYSLEVLAEVVDQEPMSSSDQPAVNLLGNNQEEEIVVDDDDAMVIMDKWIPGSSYLQNIEISHQHHQFPGFHYFGKP